VSFIGDAVEEISTTKYAMAQKAGKVAAPVQSWSDDVEDELSELVPQNAFPSIAELKTEADDIEKTLTSADDDKSLEDLIKDVETPTQPVFASSVPRNVHDRGDKPVLVKRPATSGTDSQKDTDYQESFTSQEETAQVRHYIESLDARLQVMETMIGSLAAERKGLPRHLDNYREEMNKQLTIMSDRLHTALERNIDPATVAQVNKDITVLGAETDHVFNQLKTDAESEPSKESATSQNAPISKQKKKVRVVE